MRHIKLVEIVYSIRCTVYNPLFAECARKYEFRYDVQLQMMCTKKPKMKKKPDLILLLSVAC